MPWKRAAGAEEMARVAPPLAGDEELEEAVAAIATTAAARTATASSSHWGRTGRREEEVGIRGVLRLTAVSTGTRGAPGEPAAGVERRRGTQRGGARPRAGAAACAGAIQAGPAWARRAAAGAAPRRHPPRA